MCFCVCIWIRTNFSAGERKKKWGKGKKENWPTIWEGIFRCFWNLIGYWLTVYWIFCVWWDGQHCVFFLQKFIVREKKPGFRRSKKKSFFFKKLNFLSMLLKRKNWGEIYRKKTRRVVLVLHGGWHHHHADGILIFSTSSSSPELSTSSIVGAARPISRWVSVVAFTFTQPLTDRRRRQPRKASWLVFTCLSCVDGICRRSSEGRRPCCILANW